MLTDKTGTLTENAMEFRQCSIGGKKFVEGNGYLMIVEDENTDVLSLEEGLTVKIGSRNIKRLL